MSTLAVFLLLALPVQLWILRRAQRTIFWNLERAGGSRFFAYLISVPSTVAHELAHALAAALLRVPFGRAVGGRVELFRPRRHPDGSVTLGQVSVAQTDPLRQSLISIAPLVLVPLMLLGINWALIGQVAPQNVVGALGDVETWRLISWIALSLTLPLAAFPSPGDHIGVVGAITLIAAAGLAGAAVVHNFGPAGLVAAGTTWAGILATPAIVCALLMVVLELHTRRPRRAGARSRR